MGFGSIHVERAIYLTRLLGLWSIFLGVIVIVVSVMTLPMVELPRSPADLKRPALDIDSAAADSGKAQLPSANANQNAGLVDTHETRSIEYETALSALTYLLPGVLLLLLSLRLAKLDLWAYVGTGIICIAFMAIYFAILGSDIVLDAPIHPEEIVVETLLRPVAVVVFVVCLNAMSDARDERRRRNRGRVLWHGGVDPVAPPAPPPQRTPPRPAGIASIRR
jgi:hypothetical protein